MTRICCALFLLWAVGVQAEEDPTSGRSPGTSSEGSGAKPSPNLDLESLLRIPPGGVEAPDLRGGKDRSTWQSEFSEANAEVQELEQRIAEAQEKLRESAPGDWSFTPGGGGMPSDPEILTLRAGLRRDRQSLDVARRRLQELEVEASLAGVPESWHEPAEGSP